MSIGGVTRLVQFVYFLHPKMERRGFQLIFTLAVPLFALIFLTSYYAEAIKKVPEFSALQVSTGVMLSPPNQSSRGKPDSLWLIERGGQKIRYRRRFTQEQRVRLASAVDKSVTVYWHQESTFWGIKRRSIDQLALGDEVIIDYVEDNYPHKVKAYFSWMRGMTRNYVLIMLFYPWVRSAGAIQRGEHKEGADAQQAVQGTTSPPSAGTRP